MSFLTKQEKYVAVFLLFGAVCGLSYSYYKKFHPPIDIQFRRLPDKEDVSLEELDRILKEEKTVDINHASASELTKLNGIGPVLANRIIEYRTANGPFRKKSELNNIPGIGPKKFDAIKDYILIK